MNISTLTELEVLIQYKIEKRNPIILKHPDFKHAAVLIPVFSEDNQIKFILTKRADSLKHHKGEICFPGGHQEKTDKDLIETALRETEEEIGVVREKIKVLARLDDLFTISRYIITPYVGIIYEDIECFSNDTEVAELLYVPLKLFLTEEKFYEKSWVRNGTDYPLYYYTWHEYQIWGATAYIINKFIDLVFDFQPSKINFKRIDPDLVKKFLS
ncbi:MAG: CoA pyrophosphatase [Promethearchaeota archaeon]